MLFEPWMNLGNMLCEKKTVVRDHKPYGLTYMKRPE